MEQFWDSWPQGPLSQDPLLRSCKWLLDDIHDKFRMLVSEGLDAEGGVSDDFRRRVAETVSEFDLIWGEWRSRALGCGADPIALFELEVSVNVLRQML